MSNLDQRPRDEDGERHGEWIIYYDNNQLSSRHNYVHGVAHGLCEGYAPNGSKIWCENWIMGREIGYFYWYTIKKYYLWLI